MSFSPKLGCPMCSIVGSALQTPQNTPRRTSFLVAQPEILWRDENFTVYREKAHPVSSKGHIIVAFNLHVPSIYTLSASDLPLLVNVRNIAKRLLPTLVSPPSPALSPSSTSSPASPNSSSSSSAAPLSVSESQVRIGFITPPFRDTKIPVTDHLHAHAYILPADQMGWFRGIAYGPLAWYAIDDLIAEIRESCSNNRVKSGYEGRPKAPIDMVPAAGSRTGTADGKDLSEPGLAPPDLEDGQASPTMPAARPTLLIPPQSTPHLRV